MSSEETYGILEAIAEIHNARDKLHKYEMTEEQKKEKATEEEISSENWKRAANFRFSISA